MAESRSSARRKRSSFYYFVVVILLLLAVYFVLQFFGKVTLIETMKDSLFQHCQPVLEYFNMGSYSEKSDEKSEQEESFEPAPTGVANKPAREENVNSGKSDILLENKMRSIFLLRRVKVYKDGETIKTANSAKNTNNEAKSVYIDGEGSDMSPIMIEKDSLIRILLEYTHMEEMVLTCLAYPTSSTIPFLQYEKPNFPDLKVLIFEHVTHDVVKDVLELCSFNSLEEIMLSRTLIKDISFLSNHQTLQTVVIKHAPALTHIDSSIICHSPKITNLCLLEITNSGLNIDMHFFATFLSGKMLSSLSVDWEIFNNLCVYCKTENRILSIFATVFTLENIEYNKLAETIKKTESYKLIIGLNTAKFELKVKESTDYGYSEQENTIKQWVDWLDMKIRQKKAPLEFEQREKYIYCTSS